MSLLNRDSDILIFKLVIKS